MANVGQVLKTDDGKNVIDIHLPFGNKERLSIAGNKKDPAKGENQPDFKIYGLYGEVGAIWNKVSKNNLPYKSMSLESPFGVLRFAIYDLQEQKPVKNGTKTHSIVYSTPRPQDNFGANDAAQNQENQTPGENTTKIPDVDLPPDEIPF